MSNMELDFEDLDTQHQKINQHANKMFITGIARFSSLLTSAFTLANNDDKTLSEVFLVLGFFLIITSLSIKGVCRVQ